MLCESVDASPLTSLHQHLDGPIGQFEELQDLRERTSLRMEVEE